MTRTTALALTLCLSVGGAGCRGTAPAATGERETLVIPVAATAARLGSVRARLHASGVLTPAAGAEFIAYAPEPARIIEMTRAAGEPAAAGDVLVRLDIPALAGALARERAELAQAQAALENARTSQVRARDFADRGLIARREVDDADRALADAQMTVARAEAAQARAEQAAARALIRAPFTGLVTARLHEPGDVVQGAVTDPILRLVDPRRLEVTASVAAADLPRVLPGASARMVAGGLPAPAPLAVTVAPGRPDNGGGMGTIRLAPLAPVALPVDTPVEVEIDLGERTDVVLVPPEAVLRTGATATVFVATGSVAERRVVTTGIADERGIEITDGLRAGELVITRGQNGLEEGAVLNVEVTR